MKKKDVNRKESWDYAIGLQQVDSLTPSNYLLELSNEHIQRKITTDQIRKQLNSYYQETKDSSNRQWECDMVSTRIVDFLEEAKFSLTVAFLLEVHKSLFQDVYTHVGKMRKSNISKNEPVLLGDSVIYGNYINLREMLEYDFSMQKEKDIKNMSRQELCNTITAFLSNVWQAHAFYEGNTRTCALFIETYLQSLGIKTNNSAFKENSKYYRNCLVRANYCNPSKKIHEETKYLRNFLASSMMLEELKIEDLLIQVK